MTATTIESGTSLLSPSVRLDPPTATTNRISSVAYAVDEMASEENVASAIRLGRSWCSWSTVAIGRPTRSRLSITYTRGTIRRRVVPHSDGVLHIAPCTSWWWVAGGWAP